MEDIIKVRDVITPVNNYLRSHDAVSVQATGYLRYIQLGSLKIMEEVDRVCALAGLEYFLCGGALIGAARNGLFVPWDDDIDIFLARADYERFIAVFNERCALDGISAALYSSDNGVWNMIKVRHKDIPYICVDVFCYDIMYHHLNLSQRMAFTRRLRHVTSEHANGNKELREKDIEAYHKSFWDLTIKKVPYLRPDAACRNPVLFFSLGFCHSSVTYNAFDMNDVLPVRKITFENRRLSAPANSDIFLTSCYGDYLRLPSEPVLHVNLDNISIEEALRLKSFISTMPEYHEMHKNIL